MTYYLVERDRQRHCSVWSDFSDRQTALDTLREKEAAREPHMEIVLLMAESLDQLRRTHSRYFMNAEEMLAQLGEGMKTAPA